MTKFGPSGRCEMAIADGCKSSLDMAKWLAEKGLSAYEYPFNRGVNVSDEVANDICNEMKKYDITISAHAPYYINFANPDDEMAYKSIGYVIDSLKKLKVLGGNHLVVHPASCGKLERNEAIRLTKERLVWLKDVIIQNGLDDMYVCLETMGKTAQIGSYEEIVDLCTVFDHFIPTLDFGHINALTQGSLKGEEDFEKVVKYCIDRLGYERMKNVHIHFSKIEYGAKGEIRHLTFDDQKYGPDFLPLAKVIKKYNLSPIVICESRGTQTQDAIIMKKMYETI